jgi:uncharacterized membrane-anchored protein
MLVRTRDRGRKAVEPSALVSGPARLGRDARTLARRLRPGDIAIIDEVDVDRPSAHLLLAAGVVGVVNAAPSLSGRRPAGGTQLLIDDGVPVLDTAGAQLFGQLRDGDRVRIDPAGGQLLGPSGSALAHARPVTPDLLEQAKAATAADVEDRVRLLAGDAAELLRLERDLLLDAPVSAELAQLAGRVVLLVGPGPVASAQSRGVRRWAARHDCVVLALPGAEGFLGSARLRPDLVLGTPESPLPATRLRPEAAAVAMVRACGPAAIVTIGVPTGLDALLELDRSDAAGIALVHLWADDVLVPAAAAVTMRRRADALSVWLVIAAAVVAALAFAATSAPGRALLHRWFPGWHPW